MRAFRQKKKGNYSRRAGNKKKKKWYAPILTLFSSVVAIINLACAVLLIISAYSGIVSPAKTVIFAYLGLAFPVLLAVNLFFMLWWILTKKLIMVFLVTASLIACWEPLMLYCPIHPETEVLPSGNVVKIMTYNVMSFAYKDHKPDSHNKIIDYIAASDADIVCLQEYRVSGRNNLMNSEDVAKALPMYPYISEIFFTAPGSKNYRYGLALLSKFPIISAKRIYFDSKYNGSAIYTINVRERKLFVINNHLESFKLTSQDRNIVSDMFSLTPMDVFDELKGSIQQKLGEAYRTRAHQAEVVAAEIVKSKAKYLIVCGDFNDTPLSYAHNTIQGYLTDAYKESGMGPGISYNKNYFWFRIDHLLHSSSINAYNCRVDRSIKLSDHYPMSCVVKLKD